MRPALGAAVVKVVVIRMNDNAAGIVEFDDAAKQFTGNIIQLLSLKHFHPVCGMVYIKDPFLLIKKSNPM